MTRWNEDEEEEFYELEISLGMSESVVTNNGNRGTNEGSKAAGKAELWGNGALKDLLDAGAKKVFNKPYDLKSYLKNIL